MKKALIVILCIASITACDNKPKEVNTVAVTQEKTKFVSSDDFYSMYENSLPSVKSSINSLITRQTCTVAGNSRVIDFCDNEVTDLNNSIDNASGDTIQPFIIVEPDPANPSAWILSSVTIGLSQSVISKPFFVMQGGSLVADSYRADSTVVFEMHLNAGANTLNANAEKQTLINGQLHWNHGGTWEQISVGNIKAIELVVKKGGVVKRKAKIMLTNANKKRPFIINKPESH